MLLLGRQGKLSVKTTTLRSAVNSVVQMCMISRLIVDHGITLLMFKSFFINLVDNTKSG